jgi:hypothetical protein
LDNEWHIPFGLISNPPAFWELYLVKYFGHFIYFISHGIKNRLKNVATLNRGKTIHQNYEQLSHQLVGQPSCMVEDM